MGIHTETDNVQARLALSTCPGDQAERLARGMVEARLAACVNLLPSVRSIYRWQGKVEQAEETLMVIKTTEACWGRLQAWLGRHHPYDVPELLEFEVSAGLPAYLDWIAQQTLQADPT